MSRLKRKKQQAKRIAAEKIQPTQQNVDGQKGKKKRQVEPLSKHYKTIAYSFFGLVLVGVIVLIIVLTVKSNKKPDEQKRFENITHISTNHYKVLTSYEGYLVGDLSKESDDDDTLSERDIYDQEIRDKMDIKYIYILVYNEDSEDWDEDFENFITSKYNNEAAGYALFIMNYADNPDIKSIVGDNLSVNPFALIKLENLEYKENFTSKKQIKLELA